MSTWVFRVWILLCIALALHVAGCTVGPDFVPPSPPEAAGLSAERLKERIVAEGTVQRFVGHDSLPGAWWTLFRSRQLTDLVEQALRNNHDIKAAQAALRIARANYEAQRGGLFPIIGVSETSSAAIFSFR